MEEETTEAPQGGEQEEKSKRNFLIIGLVVAIAVIGLIAISRFVTPKNPDEGSSAISGTVNFNGLKPPTDVADEDRIGKLVLMQREFGSGIDYVATDTVIPMEDDAPWTWESATEGTTYDIRVDLLIGSDTIKGSSIVTTTAPSTGQVLVLNVTLDDLPDYVIDEATVSISGTIDLNGYIPPGSAISIFQRETGTTDYKLATDDVEVSDGAKWSWDNASIGISYELRADLINGGEVIGGSSVITAVAPASGEVLKIQSKAVAPGTETKASITGTVTINGAVTNGTTLLMLQRKTGEEEYTEFDRLEPASGIEWEYKEAISGQSYDITAALQLEGENVTSGTVVTTTAPAEDETIKIDTDLSLSAPPKPTATCGDRESTGIYNVELSYAKVEDAQNYYLQAGTEPTNGDVLNEAYTPPSDGSGPDVTVVAKENTDYFTRYAYTYCTNCNQHDTQNWSAWSPTTGYRCPQ